MLSDRERKSAEKAFAEEGIEQELTLQQAKAIAEKTKVPLQGIEWFALEKGIVPCRYQKNVGNLGIDGQKKLFESSVLVVGLGGLGGFVCEELARAGTGEIAAVDHDVFDQTNLNRQLFATLQNIGSKKTDVAKKRLQQINEAVTFRGFSSPFDKIPADVWKNFDLVFDCLDNIEDRLILAKKCSGANVPLIHGAIAGWCGEVAVIPPGTQLLEQIYQRQSKGLEKEFGTPAFTAATAASIMTAEGVKLLTGKKTDRQRTILFFDLMEGKWEVAAF